MSNLESSTETASTVGATKTVNATSTARVTSMADTAQVAKTAKSANPHKPAIGIFVGGKQVNTAVEVEKFARKLKVDSNVLKVALLLVAYLALLLIISVSFNRGNILYELATALLSRGTGEIVLLFLSMPLLYFLVQWSRIIYCWRKPLNLVISALLTLAFACGILLLALCAGQAFWGSFNLIFGFIAALIVFAVAYCNNFLFALSAKYAQEYEQANQDKIRAERFKSELITNVSHDIQTPLTSIINYTDLLKNLSFEDEQFEKKFEEYTEVLERKSARLKGLTSDLIEASKAATGNTSLDLQRVNLTEAIWQVAGEFDDQFSKQNLSFVLIPTDEQFEVTADSNHLWRILENLFSNMAKYSLEGTRTFAQLERVQDGFQKDSEQGKIAGMVKLSLKNTSAEPLDQLAGELTEQFIRGDKARNTEGSGLGLYIAKSLTELMDGELRVQVSGDQFEATILLEA